MPDISVREELAETLKNIRAIREPLPPPPPRPTIRLVAGRDVDAAMVRAMARHEKLLAEIDELHRPTNG